MLKHENPNIEIINKDLWAVRFSLIPMIPQISVTRKEGTTANDLTELELTFTPDGIMILNKDHKFYDLFRNSSRTAHRFHPACGLIFVLYRGALQAEIFLLY